jgi:hypothetical protein
MSFADKVRGIRLLPIKHDHYCEDCDHRWTCDAKPCIRHSAWPCDRHAPQVPAKQSENTA